MRSKSVKEKMLFIAEKEQRILSKAPFGYINHKIGKSPSDVMHHPENAVIWKEMLRLLET